LTRCTGGAQKEELVERIMEQMKAQALAAAEEEGEGESDDEEAMDPTQVKEKLDALSEPELKQMLKEMELPTKGKVSAPAGSLDHGTDLGNSPIAPHSSHHSRTSHVGGRA
tara:strand:+ start:348 stop:680 length:333 start_codon:yes stop_codon:yes gene_type:complete